MPDWLWSESFWAVAGVLLSVLAALGAVVAWVIRNQIEAKDSQIAALRARVEGRKEQDNDMVRAKDATIEILEQRIELYKGHGDSELVASFKKARIETEEALAQARSDLEKSTSDNHELRQKLETLEKASMDVDSEAHRFLGEQASATSDKFWESVDSVARTSRELGVVPVSLALEAMRGRSRSASTAWEDVLGRIPQKTVTQLRCPSCEKKALRIGDGDPTCSGCGWSAFFGEVADAYACLVEPDWRHLKHRPDDSIFVCARCEYQTAVPTGPELRRSVSAYCSRMDEYVSDIPIYVCLNCGALQGAGRHCQCDYCGTNYFDEGPEGRMCPVCGKGF